MKCLPSQLHHFFAALKTDAGIIASAGLTSSSGSTPTALLAHQAAAGKPCALRQGIRYCSEGWSFGTKSIDHAKQPLASPVCIRSNESGIPCFAGKKAARWHAQEHACTADIVRRKTSMLKALSVDPAFSQVL